VLHTPSAMLALKPKVLWVFHDKSVVKIKGV